MYSLRMEGGCIEELWKVCGAEDSGGWTKMCRIQIRRQGWHCIVQHYVIRDLNMMRRSKNTMLLQIAKKNILLLDE